MTSIIEGGGFMTHSGFFVKRVANGCAPDCEKRNPGCQDHCETLLKSKQINEDFKKKVKEEKEKRRLLDYIPPRDRRR